MPNPDLQESRVENITAALVYGAWTSACEHAKGGGAGDPRIH